MNLLIKLAEKISSKLSEKRENELTKFKEKMKMYENLSDDEFMYEYVNVLTRCESIKTRLINVLILLLIINVIINYFDVAIYRFTLLNLDGKSMIVLVGIKLSFVALLLIILIFYCIYFKADFASYTRDKMLLQEVKEIRKKERSENLNI